MSATAACCEARATALEVSSAPYVFPLDSDDVAAPGVLGRMADLLDADREAVVCFGDYEEFGDAQMVRAVPEQIDPFRIAYANELAVSSMFRRSLLDELGGWGADGFSERSHEDWNLWMAIAERGYRGVHLGPGEVVYRRRMHAGRLLEHQPQQAPGALQDPEGHPPAPVRRPAAPPARVRHAGPTQAPVPDRLRRQAQVRVRAAS